MKYKLYRAIDKSDNIDSSFIVRPDNRVAVSPWTFSAEKEIELAKRYADKYATDSAERFKEAINPVLIAEW
jgi:hypothetical protein